MFPARPNKTRPLLINASGFTLGQLLASLTVITVCAVFVATVYSSLAHFANHKRNLPSCASNIKQLGMGFLQYIQDYDEKLPPCAVSTTDARVLLGWAATHNQQGKGALIKQATYGQLIGSYIKDGQIFYCPQVSENYGTVDYMYNDLAAEVAQNDFAAPDRTVLVCDGENFAGNVGHAYEPTQAPNAPQFSLDGAVILGATLATAPIRHKDGANYGFVDGHVKWSRLGGVFFPFRQDNSRSHINKYTGSLIGPDPTKLDLVGYIGTFHVN